MHSLQVMHTTSRNDRGTVYCNIFWQIFGYLGRDINWKYSSVYKPQLTTFNLMKFTGGRICNKFHLEREDREPKTKRNNHSKMINCNSLSCTVSLSNQKINKAFILHCFCHWHDFCYLIFKKTVQRMMFCLDPSFMRRQLGSTPQHVTVW